MSTQSYLNDQASIRIGQPTDLSACLELLGQFYLEEKIPTTAEQMTPPMQSLLQGAHGVVLLAEQRGKHIGLAVIVTVLGVEQGGRVAELTDLFIEPEFRGAGVGGSLISFAAEWAEENKCRRLQLCVTAAGQSARDLIGFYQGHGFEPTGRTLLSRAL